MTRLPSLAGSLQVHPGRPRPHSLHSTRRAWAGVLALGQPAHQVPDLMANVFNLCGAAHRLCARLALQAAQDVPAPDAGTTLRAETVREHVRRLCLDWPLALAPQHTALQARALEALRACPALHAEAAVGAMASWLEQHLLAMPASAWWARWDRDRGAWLHAWAASTSPSWLARMLDACRRQADVPLPQAVPLRVAADEDDLRQLAERWRQDPHMALAPTWHGACADTGCWTRLNDDAPPARSAWDRLGARIAELVRLSTPQGAGWLRSGALKLSRGAGMGYVEMARGLLLHHVLLQHEAGAVTVAHYGVIAPTEWNFHAHGALAEALATLDPGADGVQERVAAWMAAFDPCVRYELASQPHSHRDLHHA